MLLLRSLLRISPPSPLPARLSRPHHHHRAFTSPALPPVSRQKSISVAIVGAPNAGKSTLLNAIVGRHVSAVSPRAQTTRDLIVGLATRDDSQIIFYDTPGVLDLQSQRQLKLPRQIATAPAHAMSQVDHALLVIDASTLHLALRKLALSRVLTMLQDLSPRDQSSNATVKVTVALNKVDLVSPKSNVPSIVQDVKLLLGQAQHCAVDEFFLVCALQGRGEGVADLTRHLASLATLQPWLHDRHTVSTSTLESIVVEMVRERLFYHIRQEVPYSCRVVVQECETFEQQDGRSAVRAVANIVVKKSLHKVSRSCASFYRAHNSLACIQSMVIGPGGSNIRKICQEAEVSELLSQFTSFVTMYLFAATADLTMLQAHIALATGATKAHLRIDVVSEQ